MPRKTKVIRRINCLMAIYTGVLLFPLTHDLRTYQGRTVTFVSSCANKPPGFGNPSTRPMPQSPAESETIAVSAPSASELTSAGGR